MPVSVWEGGDSWLREVTGRHGSNFLPFSGPSVGYWISFLGSLGNGRFGPNPSRGVTGANFCHLAAPGPPIEFLFWDHWETAVWGQILAGRSREVRGGYGRLREVTEEENEGKWRNGRKRLEKTKESEGKSLKAGGKWRNSEAQRRAAKWYRGGEGLQSKQKSFKGAADGLGF